MYFNDSAKIYVAGHRGLVGSAICRELKNQGMSDVIVVAGGVIPEQDYPFLYNAGVDFVFGPGTVIAEAAMDILTKMSK